MSSKTIRIVAPLIVLLIAMQSCITLTVLYTVDFRDNRRICYDLTRYDIPQVDSIIEEARMNNDIVVCVNRYPTCLYLDTMSRSYYLSRGGEKVRHISFLLRQNNCVANGRLVTDSTATKMYFGSYTMLDENYQYTERERVVPLESAQGYPFYHKKRLRRRFNQEPIVRELDTIVVSLFDTKKKWKRLEPLWGRKGQ